MGILKFFWIILVIAVEVFALWHISTEKFVPIFGETVIKEIRVVGFNRYTVGWRSLSECYSMMPNAIYSRIVACGIEPIDPKNDHVLLVEVSSADLKAAEAITKRIQNNEPQELCTSLPWYAMQSAKCFTQKPSKWLNPQIKYNFSKMDARAIGTPQAPPKIGEWRLESALIGLLLTLGSLLVAGGVIAMGVRGSNRD